MATNRGLYVPINATGNVGTTELEARLAQAGQYEHNAAGVPRSGLLIPAGSSQTVAVTGAANMSYNLAACYPVINTAANDGVYAFSATGTTNVATGAAPATDSRIDLLWVKQNDKSKGDADNLAVFGVTQGATATTPVAPALPARAMEVARATILSTTTATNTAAITQTFRYAALKGTPIPVRDAADFATITAPAANQLVRRLDLAGAPEFQYNGTRWARTTNTELGRASIGGGALVAASPAWTDLGSVSASTLGGQVILEYSVAVANGNSGANRACAVQVTCDGASVDAWAFTIPFVSGIDVPAFPSLQVAHTPAAGAHVWKIQSQAGSGDANSVIVLKGSFSVTEKP